MFPDFTICAIFNSMYYSIEKIIHGDIAFGEAESVDTNAVCVFI